MKSRQSAILQPLEARSLLSVTTIMPLGDSITEGLDGHATYRYWLWHSLRQIGRDVDFVGTLRGVFDGKPRFADFDQDHQGRVGFRADTVLRYIDEFLWHHRPDIVLLHIGSNDLFQNQTIDSTINEIGRIIDRLRVANPQVAILLAKIIPSSRAPHTIPQFNQRIPELAASKTTGGSPVIVVDQYSGFSIENDTIDGVHPNESGERKLAARWMSALARVSMPPQADPYLSDLPFQSARNGLGPVERNKSNGGAEANDGRSLKFNGTRYARGLGVHAPSDVRFSLGGRYRLFTADLGIDDEVQHRGSVIFRVYVDYVKVYDSGLVTGRTNTRSIRIDVSGAQNLRLLVSDGGNGNIDDHADWADARLFSAMPITTSALSARDLLGGDAPTLGVWSDLEDLQQQP